MFGKSLSYSKELLDETDNWVVSIMRTLCLGLFLVVVVDAGWVMDWGMSF